RRTVILRVQREREVPIGRGHPRKFVPLINCFGGWPEIDLLSQASRFNKLYDVGPPMDDRIAKHDRGVPLRVRSIAESPAASVEILRRILIQIARPVLNPAHIQWLGREVLDSLIE